MQHEQLHEKLTHIFYARIFTRANYGNNKLDEKYTGMPAGLPETTGGT